MIFPSMCWLGAPGRTTALGAIALALLLSGGGCKKTNQDNSPVGVVKQFMAASQEYETKERHEAMYKLLGPRTQARLKASARRATAATGGKRTYAPYEMLSASSRPGARGDWTAKPKGGFKELSKSANAARVQVTGEKKGQVQVVDLVKVDGKWRIELPLVNAKPAPGRPAPSARPAPRPEPRPAPKP